LVINQNYVKMHVQQNVKWRRMFYDSEEFHTLELQWVFRHLNLIQH
jgi:hypothetical protein